MCPHHIFDGQRLRREHSLFEAAPWRKMKTSRIFLWLVLAAFALVGFCGWFSWLHEVSVELENRVWERSGYDIGFIKNGGCASSDDISCSLSQFCVPVGMFFPAVILAIAVHFYRVRKGHRSNLATLLVVGIALTIVAFIFVLLFFWFVIGPID